MMVITIVTSPLWALVPLIVREVQIDLQFLRERSFKSFNSLQGIDLLSLSFCSAFGGIYLNVIVYASTDFFNVMFYLNSYLKLNFILISKSASLFLFCFMHKVS